MDFCSDSFLPLRGEGVDNLYTKTGLRELKNKAEEYKNGRTG